MKYSHHLIKAKKIAARKKKNKEAENFIDIKISPDNSIHFIKSNLTYKPHLTLNSFHNDDSKIRIVMGPFGSGKTTAMISEILIRASKMPKCKDGIRRSKTLVIRNTYNDLKRTSYKSWLDWTEKLDISGEPYLFQQSPMVCRHLFNDGNGLIELELHFLSVDSAKQLRQLKSFETTNVWLSEVSELNKSVLDYVVGRIGRYPMKSLLPENESYWCGVFAETNAPNERHWIERKERNSELIFSDKFKINEIVEKYKIFDEDKTISTKIWHQPSALIKNEKGNWCANENAENIEYLEGGYKYYFDMLQNGEEFVRIYVQGKYGSVHSGMPVFPKYNDDIHSTEKIEIDKNVEIIYGVDYGRIAPAILACQWVAGQLRCIKEFCGDHLYISDLANEEVIPWLEKNSSRDSHNRIRARGKDDCSQTDDGRRQLLELKMDVSAARTNKIEPRLDSVNQLLSKISSTGFPSLLISRIGCPNLRRGFNGHYCLEQSRINGEIHYKETPSKTHPYSDVHDALQYVALEFAREPEKEIKVNFKSLESSFNSEWL